RLSFIISFSSPFRRSMQVGLLPRADTASGFVEQPRVVAFQYLLTGFHRQQFPKRRVTFVDSEVVRCIARCYDIGAEQETIRIAIDHVRRTMRNCRILEE